MNDHQLAVWSFAIAIISTAFGIVMAVREWKNNAVWRERKRTLQGIQRELQQLRTMLTEVGIVQTIIKTEPEKQFVRQIGHQVRGIEHHVDLLLLADEKPLKPAVSVANRSSDAHKPDRHKREVGEDSVE